MNVEEGVYPYKNTFRKRVGAKVYQLCRICKEWKLLSEFANEKRFFLDKNKKIKRENGRRTKCSSCQKEYFKKWYQANSEYKIKQSLKNYYEKRNKDIDFTNKTENKKLVDIAFNKFKKNKMKRLHREESKKLKKAKNLLSIWMQ